MRQRLGLILAVTVSGSSTVACHSGNSKSVNDGAGSDAATDSSLPLPGGPYVENAGEACETDTDCKGSMAVCQTELMAPGGGGTIPFPGGYCTATCTATTPDQCGSGSECGIKKLVETLQPLLAAAGMGAQLGFLDMVPSQCLDACGGSGDCRDGYSCVNLIEASGQSAQVPAQAQPLLFLLSKYCLPGQPPMNNVDGSMPEPDASMPELDGATPDAGTSDASTSDAGRSDASTSDAGT